MFQIGSSGSLLRVVTEKSSQTLRDENETEVFPAFLGNSKTESWQYYGNPLARCVPEFHSDILRFVVGELCN